MNMNQNNEINDLYDYGYKIVQNKDYFKFSMDSVLLAEFVDVKANQKNIIDLCSGNAPVPMILSSKYGDKLNLTGVELQKTIYDMGVESININEFKNINFINEDVNKLITNHDYDIVTCNPPYFKKYSDENINDNDIKAIARHEITVNLEEIISISSKLLKNQGYFYMVHRPERLADIVLLLNKYDFGLKKVQSVFNDRNSDCCFILIEAIYKGKDYVKIESPLFLKEHETYKDIFRK